MDQTHQAELQALITDGAELIVTEPGGDTVFNAPLARACRLDADDPTCLWVRPLAPPITADGATVFALNQCRRRALHLDAVHTEADSALVIALSSGQQARIQPATGPAAETLDAWDTFIGARLTAAEELALDALEEDSWTGRYA
jgi:hypothetical protein